jgi:hypothetical protein
MAPIAGWSVPEPLFALALILGLGLTLLHWPKAWRDIPPIVFGASLIAGLIIAVSLAFSA